MPKGIGYDGGKAAKAKAKAHKGKGKAKGKGKFQPGKKGVNPFARMAK